MRGRKVFSLIVHVSDNLTLSMSYVIIWLLLLMGGKLCHGATGDVKENTEAATVTVTEVKVLETQVESKSDTQVAETKTEYQSYDDTTTDEATTPTATATAQESTSCKLPKELLKEGYEIHEGKHYKLYGNEKDWANNFDANSQCNKVGARLAMFKDHQDLEIVKKYRGEMNNSYCNYCAQ